MNVSNVSDTQRGTKRKRHDVQSQDRGVRVARPGATSSKSSQPITHLDGERSRIVESKASSQSVHPVNPVKQNGKAGKAGNSRQTPQPVHLVQQNGKSISSTQRPQNPLAARRSALQVTRQKLPIWPHAASIRDSLSQTDILLLAGETGSGKSTQVPQFLLPAQWCTQRIAVTQPRRMAAISLARRVAEELGTPLGKTSAAAQVGYSVRFDDNVGKSNRIKFLTEGMLLQELLRDPGLAEYSCVVVDEVHERSVNVDLILGFLRDLITQRGEGAKRRKGRPLKVVIMSATADTEVLKTFFEQGYLDRTLPSTEPMGSAREDSTAINSEKKSKKASFIEANGASHAEATQSATNGSSPGHVTTCFVQGRQFPVQTIYLPEPIQDFSDAALKCIFQVHCKEPMPGDILVFLTGQDTVQSLQKLVEEYAQTLTADYPKVRAKLCLYYQWQSQC